MKWVLATVSAVALAASPAFAGKENGKGNGNGNKHNDRGSQQFDRGNGHDGGKKEMRSFAQNEHRGSGNSAKKDAKKDKGWKADRAPQRVDRSPERYEDRGKEWRDDRDQRTLREIRMDRAERRYDDDDDRRYARRDRDSDGRFFGIDFDGDRHRYSRYASQGLIDGCPPGLAKKNNGCMPPGQAKKYDDDYRYSYSRYQPSWWGMPYYDRGDYFYRDGYLMRLDGGRNIAGYIPLLGGALTIGNPWPTGYGRSDFDPYYVDYYGLGGSDRYRYADNVVYRLDPETAAITSVAALLTGDDFVIGQPAPMGYDVYNVPYTYRDRYYDRPDAYYRYSDGYVYQIDPTTQLVAAAIQLIL